MYFYAQQKKLTLIINISLRKFLNFLKFKSEFLIKINFKN